MYKTYLKETFSYIIDNFGTNSRKHFSLACTLIFIFTFICALLCLLIFGSLPTLSSPWLNSFFATTLSWDNTNNRILLYSLSIINLSLYGSFLISSINDPALSNKDSFSLADFMNNISMREWMWFGLSQFIVIVLFFIGYNPFEFFRAFHMAMANNTTEGQSHFWLYRMIVWLYSVFDLVKIIIASFLAAVFVVRIYEQKLKPGVLGKYRESIYASMTGSIFLYLAFMPVVKIYKTDVVGFLELLPYASKFHILPFVFDIVFKVFLLAIFTWIAAAAISIPIKTQYDLEWEEKDATTESEFAE